MKRRWLVLGLIGGIVLALGAAAGVFFSRPPVLIVTDVPIAALYGTRRMFTRQVWDSLLLFRPVVPAPVAEGVGSDMLVFAIEDAASKLIAKRPYCVVFPYEYADGFRRYREQRPDIPAILLTGRFNGNSGRYSNDDGASFVFSTDIERDFYRAGIGAAILSRGKTGNIIVFLDRFVQSSGREAFIKGLREGGNEGSPLFLYSFSELSESNRDNIACAVLVGAGAEYFEQNLHSPVVLFTWLDPDFASPEVALIFDDSPWSLAVSAVKMMLAQKQAEKQNEGQIPSDALVIPARVVDNDILKQLKKVLRDLDKVGGKGPSGA